VRFHLGQLPTELPFLIRLQETIDAARAGPGKKVSRQPGAKPRGIHATRLSEAAGLTVT